MPTEQEKNDAIKTIMNGGNPADDMISVSTTDFSNRGSMFPSDAAPGTEFEAKKGRVYVKKEHGGWVEKPRAGTEGGVPMFCPECESVMTHRNDTKMYRVHDMCFDCVLEMEHEIRCNGNWELYEKRKVLNNMRDWIRDNRAELEVFARNIDASGHVTQDGRVTEWLGGNGDEVIAQYREFLDKLDEKADALEERVEELASESNA